MGYSFFITALVVLIVVAAWFYAQNRAKGRIKTKSGQYPVLSQYTRDLTQLAAENQLDPVIGREQEIKRVIQILSRRTKNNPILIGRAGVGKTAIVEGLAQAIIKKQVPESLLNKRVLSLDLGGLVAGTKYRGEFEQRVKKLADEIISAKRQIILFIDEIHTLAGAGEATGAIDADDILKPPLARGDLQVVGATTPQEYERFIKTDTTLDRRLEPILISEPTAEETLAILKGVKSLYENHHRVKITDEALKTAVNEAAVHLPDRAFPDKAIDLMDEAASKVKLEVVTRQKNGKQKVESADIKEVVKDRMS
jgi:ATP-dependent Clp protease ATP-binding subunit ClpC